MGKARTAEEKDAFIATVTKWAKRAGAVVGALGALLTPMLVMWLQVADAKKQSKAAKAETVEVKKEQDIGYEKVIMPALEALQKGSEEEQAWAYEINAYLDEHALETREMQDRLIRLEAIVDSRHGSSIDREPASVANMSEPMPFQVARPTADLPKVKLYKDLETATKMLEE